MHIIFFILSLFSSAQALNKNKEEEIMRKLCVIGTFIGGFILGGNLIAAESATTTTTTVVTPATPAQPATATTVVTPATSTQPATTTTTTVGTQQPKPPYKGLSNPFACFGRGLVNITTCWLEIPRCIVYDAAAIPFFGLIVGIPDGAFFTVTRVLAGAGDIITLGFIGDVYTRRYPDFIWESSWQPPKMDKE